MMRANSVKIGLATVLLSLGLVTTAAPSLAQNSDDEEAVTDTLICMATYAIFVNRAPEDGRAKQGMVITVDIYQALTGKTDDEVTNDVVDYATTLDKLDKDGVQPLSAVRDHCDAVFMDL